MREEVGAKPESFSSFPFFPSSPFALLLLMRTAPDPGRQDERDRLGFVVVMESFFFPLLFFFLPPPPPPSGIIPQSGGHHDERTDDIREANDEIQRFVSSFFFFPLFPPSYL